MGKRAVGIGPVGGEPVMTPGDDARDRLLERDAEAYCDTIMAMPAMQEWVVAAKNEPMIIEAYEF
jgi:hypothetical protein